MAGQRGETGRWVAMGLEGRGGSETEADDLRLDSPKSLFIDRVGSPERRLLLVGSTVGYSEIACKQQADS